MNRLSFFAVVALLALAAAPAQARGHIGVFIGGTCCYDPYWGPYAMPYPPYYPPPPVVVAPAPVVVTPPPAVYVAPDGTIPANQTSPTFTDSQGRTCRNYETQKIEGGMAHTVHGTACLFSDGAWRVVD